MNKELSPMMKQFYELKEKHPDALMLFRCGDFYETYCDDAVEAARILGITLTKRNNGAGKRVAICDQLEAPKKTVKRGITELVTPMVNQ